MAPEAVDVTDICSLEAVDCLVVITDCHDVRATLVDRTTRQRKEDAQLREVGILEFIYHDVLVLLLKISAQLRLSIERLSELENHIIVVIQTSRAQLSKICLIDLSKGA